MGRKWSQQEKDRMREIMRSKYAGASQTHRYTGESLRGYGYEIHRRDNFVCQYCGADGKKSFEVWLTFSVDHLLPKGHPERDNSDYIVTACAFCNIADNHYFDQIQKRGLSLDGLTPQQLVEQRRQYVLPRRETFREFWQEYVQSSQSDDASPSSQ